MLKYNSYLKKLGVKKSDFPFKKEDRRYYEDPFTHIAEVETWNLDSTLIMVLYSYLMYFRDVTICHPVRYTEQEWDNILNEMIKGFEDYIKWDYNIDKQKDTCDEYFTEQEEVMNGVNRSMELLADNLFDLDW